MTTITKAYVRFYSDNKQTKAYVEWADGSRTEGEAREARKPCPCCSHPLAEDWGGYFLGAHMASLFARADREGVPITHENW